MNKNITKKCLVNIIDVHLLFPNNTTWTHKSRIVDVVLNLMSLLFLFICIRFLLGFILRMIDYGRRGLPVLKQYDAIYSCGIGFLHGVILLYIFFMLVPIMLLVVPARFSALITDTPLGGFFYRMNPFVWLIPTT